MPPANITRCESATSLHVAIGSLLPALANALRRNMATQVPTLAINVVTIEENETGICDDRLIHFLGMIPLHSHHIGSMLLHADCTCAGECERCAVVFHLDVTCPPTHCRWHVTARDLVSSDPRACPVLFTDRIPPELNASDFDSMRIATLAQNKRLRLRCVAHKGVGAAHAKWGPCCPVGLAYIPHIRIDSSIESAMTNSQRKEVAGCCPRQVFDIEDAGALLTVARSMQCNFCQLCVEKTDEMNLGGLISVREEEDVDAPGRFNFLFQINTNGSLTSREVLMGSVNELRRSLVHIREAVERLP